MKCVFEVNTICRLCLRVDEKVCKMNRKHHKAFIESIIQLKKFNGVPTEDQYVCYICNALIIKTYNFIQTIWNAQEIVCGILKKTNVVTKPMLEHIERHDKGLNPITLSSVVIYENENLCGICEDTNPNTKLEGEINRHKYKENLKKETINEISLISSSDEDIQLSEKCYLDDVQVDIHNHLKKVDIETISGDPLEENDTNLKQKFAKDLSMEECEDPKPEKKKKIGVPFKKKPDSSSRKKEIQRKKKPVDKDYQPDSTSDTDKSDFDSWDDWGRLLKRPKDDRVYPRQCDHCDFEVPKKNDHYRHYQFMHPKIQYPYPAVKNFVCSICGKSMTKHHIRAHEESHTIQELKCVMCPKVFPSKLKLYSHLQNAHPKRTYTCDYCSKIFKTRNEIYRHIRIHTGSKPFKCHICGDGFAHSGNRTLHIRNKHQNLKYVPKKQSTNIRKNKKRDLTGTVMTGTKTCSDDESIQSTKKKTIRKNKNKPKSAVVTRKEKKNTKRRSDKNRKLDCSDTAMVSEEGKQKQKRKKKTHLGGDRHRTVYDTYDTDMNIDQRNKNHENGETESDDETLAIIKKKKDKH